MSDEKIAQKTMDDDEVSDFFGIILLNNRIFKDSPTPMDALNGQCEMCANYEVS